MQLDLGSQGGFVLLAIAVGLYSLTAGWLAKHSVSAAFSFLAIGALLGGAGIAVLGGRIPERALLSLLAEITLALVLFSAASTLRIREIEGDSEIVLRLIVIGLPLTIAAGTALALGLFPGISVGLALLMATTLAPTDADLGHQVITDRSVPARIRRVLNVEGGLNDGVAAPVITVAIALAA
ncbi:MAG: cation:proton antiporter, partial [Chloroflexota bacterium]